MANKASESRVRIYPTEGYYIPGIPAVQMLLDPDVADRLLAYNPPAFTRTKPDGVELDAAPLESLDGLHLPWEPTNEPPPGGEE